MQGIPGELEHGTFCGYRTKWTIFSLRHSLQVEYKSLYEVANIDSFTAVHQIVDASLKYRHFERSIVSSVRGNAPVSLYKYNPVMRSTKAVRFEWLLKAHVGYYIVITVTEISILSEHLEFYDGPLPYVQNTKHLVLHNPVLSTGFQATLVYVTDKMDDMGNVTLQFSEYWSGCDYVLNVSPEQQFIHYRTSNQTMSTPYHCWNITAPTPHYLEMNIINLRFSRIFHNTQCAAGGLAFTEHQPYMRTDDSERSEFFKNFFPVRVACTDITAPTHLYHTTRNEFTIYLYTFVNIAVGNISFRISFRRSYCQCLTVPHSSPSNPLELYGTSRGRFTLAFHKSAQTVDWICQKCCVFSQYQLNKMTVLECSDHSRRYMDFRGQEEQCIIAHFSGLFQLDGSNSWPRTEVRMVTFTEEWAEAENLRMLSITAERKTAWRENICSAHDTSRTTNVYTTVLYTKSKIECDSSFFYIAPDCKKTQNVIEVKQCAIFQIPEVNDIYTITIDIYLKEYLLFIISHDKFDCNCPFKDTVIIRSLSKTKQHRFEELPHTVGYDYADLSPFTHRNSYSSGRSYKDTIMIILQRQNSSKIIDSCCNITVIKKRKKKTGLPWDYIRKKLPKPITEDYLRPSFYNFYIPFYHYIAIVSHEISNKTWLEAKNDCDSINATLLYVNNSNFEAYRWVDDFSADIYMVFYGLVRNISIGKQVCFI